MIDFPLPLKGGCFCGKIRYRVGAAPSFAMACHCADCQQMTASAVSLGLVVPKKGFSLAYGAPRRVDKTADSGGTSTRYVCPSCATWTHTATSGSPEMVVVRPSTLDDRDWVQPVAQIFTRSVHRWALLTVPLSYEAEFEDIAPIEAAFVASDIRPGKAA